MTSTAGSIPPILLVGCGRMGSAMLAGWREQGFSSAIVVDPSPDAAKPAGMHTDVEPRPTPPIG